MSCTGTVADNREQKAEEGNEFEKSRHRAIVVEVQGEEYHLAVSAVREFDLWLKSSQ